jgi:putative flippase GtrA
MAHSSLALAQNTQSRQLVKFILAGILNTIVGYGAFFLLLYFFDYMAALVGAYAVGIANGFVWNKYWTFRSDKSKTVEFIKYNSVYVLSFIINAAALSVMVDRLSVDPKAGQLILLPVTTLVSYLGHKYWSFR